MVSSGIPGLETAFGSEPSVGIGRAATDQWVEIVVGAISVISNGTAQLQPRFSAAMTYVSAKELGMLGGDSSPAGVERTSEQLKILLTSMAVDEALYLPTIESESTLNLDYYRLTTKSHGEHSLEAKIWDKKNKNYACGYQIEGERRAVREALGLPPTNRKDNPREPRPFRWLRIGKIGAVKTGLIDTTSINTGIQTGLPSHNVPLQPVGPIRADLRPPND